MQTKNYDSISITDITNLAGVVLSYDRLSKKDYENGSGTDKDRKLIIAKERLFGNTDYNGIILHYDMFSKRIYSDADNVNEYYGWDIVGNAEKADSFMMVPDDDFNPFAE